jgi:hypothetical protein
MPIFKPGGTIDIVLDCDAGEERPLKFTVAALSVNQANDLGDRLDAVLAEASTERERQEQLTAIISPLITGWVNGPTEYSWHALLDNLGPVDLWSLAYAIKRQIGYREKKA